MELDSKIIQIKDKKFELSITEFEIQKAVQHVADQIAFDFEGKSPLFIAVLNGAFMFAADLMKHINIPCEISFVKFNSYVGTQSTGIVHQFQGLNQSVEGRDVIVVEDIIDTGATMHHVIKALEKEGAQSITVASFFLKPDALQQEVKVDYVAMKIPNHFIVGYGLDYDGFGRNLKNIYTLIQD
jgi:hypoxanthine phosphoribosyltransferase